jgi:hypothetical protein
MSDDDEVIVICGSGENPSPWDDDIKGECADCQTSIRWRPHSPEGATRVCLACGLKRVDESTEPPEFVITQKDQGRA